MTKTLRHLCGLLLAARALFPADAGISGPIAGYAADPSRAVLRAISGVPGSYLLSDPLTLPDGASRVHMAPAQDYALVESTSVPPAIVFLTGGAVDHVSPLPAAIEPADWIAFSTGAASAVFFSSAAHRLQLFTGLPTSPQLALDVDATTLPEQPFSAAVSDDGRLLLIASGNSVYRLSSNGSPQLLLSAGRIVSLAVLRDGAGAVVADASTASIQVLRNLDTAPDIHVLISGIEGVGKLFPAADGATLFVARPGVKAVSAIDLASGAMDTFPSPTAPGALLPLRNRDTFLVSARPGQPAAVFFRDPGGSRVVLIPAVPGGAAQ